jgi:hypothetical protein
MGILTSCYTDAQIGREYVLASGDEARSPDRRAQADQAGRHRGCPVPIARFWLSVAGWGQENVADNIPGPLPQLLPEAEAVVMGRSLTLSPTTTVHAVQGTWWGAVCWRGRPWDHHCLPSTYILSTCGKVQWGSPAPHNSKDSGPIMCGARS